MRHASIKCIYTHKYNIWNYVTTSHPNENPEIWKNPVCKVLGSGIWNTGDLVHTVQLNRYHPQVAQNLPDRDSRHSKQEERWIFPDTAILRCFWQVHPGNDKLDAARNPQPAIMQAAALLSQDDPTSHKIKTLRAAAVLKTLYPCFQFHKINIHSPRNGEDKNGWNESTA